jgi:hypothetical protein
MARSLIFIMTLMFGMQSGLAQKAIDAYVGDTGDYKAVVSTAPGTRTDEQIENVLPTSKFFNFAEYVAAKRTGVDIFTFLKDVDKLRMNKQLGSPGGATGVTSLISNVAGPGLIGLGVEYGAIQENSSGNTTTLRANLLGVSRLLLGQQTFPYCAEINQKACQPASRWLRRFSGNASFQNTNSTTATTTATPVNSTTPTAVDLFGNGYKMISWGARFDITANDPNDPGFLDRFEGAISTLRNRSEPASLAQSIEALFSDPVVAGIYDTWEAQTRTILQNATKDEFKQKLEHQLDVLVDNLVARSPDFLAKVEALRGAALNYFSVRDDLLRDIQSRRFSVEYTNLHALNQPTTSNLRFIFSHQPSAAPLLITANAAMTWYNSLPAGATTGRLRDVQAAAKIDRRLGQIPNLGNAVLTVGGYYQWMKEDALIEIGPGNVAPGSGIVLPGTAATLLGTKGNIGIVQGRVTVPLNNTVKIPLSLTWSNRTELIKESDTRGQIGVTFDIDSLFR